MARGEGESVLRSHFVERVVKLPVVHVAWDYASYTYTHLKESSRLVNFTLTNAERSVTFVAEQAKPVVKKFEKQIQVVDDIACYGLGTLEKKVPILTKPAEEIIGDTRKLYENAVTSRIENIRKYGNDTVRSAADFGLRHATTLFGNRLVQSVLTSVDGVLVLTENYVDRLLPPDTQERQKNGGADKKKEEGTEKVPGAVRLARISTTIRQRAYRTLQLKLEYAQDLSLDLLLTYPITMIELTKTQLDRAVEFANRLWQAIMQNETQDTDSAETQSRVEQQLLILARQVSRQVASTYATFGATHPAEATDGQEPDHATRAMTTARDGALWVYGMLRLVPQLLPMYIYGFASWLEQLKKPAEKEEEKPHQNGYADKREQNGGLVQANSSSSPSNKAAPEESYRDHSIPEEDED